jgi:hypothetical protein
MSDVNYRSDVPGIALPFHRMPMLKMPTSTGVYVTMNFSPDLSTVVLAIEFGPGNRIASVTERVKIS